MIKTGFSIHEKNGVSFLKIPSFEKAGGVCCAFSTRIGGVSKKPYNTLNFSRKREQNQHNFIENLARFSAAAGFDGKRAVCINYAHSAKIYRAVKSDSGRGVISEPLHNVCDGLYTIAAGLPLISFHADCAPLFFYDPIRRAAAVCHAGWRGIAEHFAKISIDTLCSAGCGKSDILAAVGPCISVKHFEIGEDVKKVFETEFGKSVVRERDGRYYADLNKACIDDMLSAGILPENITDARLCTYENKELFFSHRRDKGQTGAMAAVIALV